MPRLIDTRDRKLLIGAALLLVALVVVVGFLAPSRVSGVLTIPSSYSPSWDGAEAAFLLLRQLGYRVQRWERPAAQLPASGQGDILIIANPAQQPTGDDRTAIRTFLENGGRVLATGSAAADFLPQSQVFEENTPWVPWKDFFAQLPSPLTRDAPRITMLPPRNWEPQAASLEVVYADADGLPGIVTFPFGGGQVIWWAAPTPLTNGAIRESGNLALLLNCLGAPGENRIFWDEYYHGVRPSLWSYFQRTPLPWILAQFALVFLAILFTFSRRQGSARAPAVVSRLSPLEFVDTLGDLYHTAHAGPAAVSIAYERLHFLLVRRLALPAAVSLPELCSSAAGRFAWPQAPLLDCLTRAERERRAPQLGDEAALQLVREIHHYIARLQPAAPPASPVRGEPASPENRDRAAGSPKGIAS